MNMVGTGMNLENVELKPELNDDFLKYFVWLLI